MSTNDSWASSEAARNTMRANRSRDTRPEMAVRRLLHAHGLRYRVSTRPERDLRRTADILFRPAKVAVFIDGCFWHGCPLHVTSPKTHAAYWAQKIAENQTRDAETTRVLQSRGWLVLRFWEHESPSEVAMSVERAVRQRRSVTERQSRTAPGRDASK